MAATLPTDLCSAPTMSQATSEASQDSSIPESARLCKRARYNSPSAVNVQNIENDNMMVVLGANIDHPRALTIGSKIEMLALPRNDNRNSLHHETDLAGSWVFLNNDGSQQLLQDEADIDQQLRQRGGRGLVNETNIRGSAIETTQINLKLSKLPPTKLQSECSVGTAVEVGSTSAPREVPDTSVQSQEHPSWNAACKDTVEVSTETISFVSSLNHGELCSDSQRQIASNQNSKISLVGCQDEENIAMMPSNASGQHRKCKTMEDAATKSTTTPRDTPTSTVNSD